MNHPRLFGFKPIRQDEPYAAPTRMRPGDAGYDLVVSRYMQVFNDQNAQLPTNIAVQIPDGFFGLILPRSSTLSQKGLLVHPGVIDSGYRGEVMILVRNVSGRSVHVQEKERIAQLLVLPVVGYAFKELDSLSLGSRGDSGFGSTGGYGEA